ncbi:MAG TPA: S53 family peptidase [Acidobacteriaceae bacterium]|nr:S53 family peptidase [Acidobacteriaceae bacterium]
MNRISIRTAARSLGITAAVTLFALLMPAPGFSAQKPGTPLVSLPGHVRPDVKSAKDNGAVDSSLQLDHMLLQLQRPAAREAALEARIEAMHQPGSPDFHHWLTADELGQQYGPDPADIQRVSQWLQSYGLQVNGVSKSGLSIDFSGTAAQITSAMHVALHSVVVKGKNHFANMQNPQVPAEFANLIVGVSSLNDFRPKPAHTPISARRIDSISRAVVPHGTQATNSAATSSGATPGFTVDSSYQVVVPNDLHTIYNFDGVYSRGITGKKQEVVVIEDSNVYSTKDWNTFRRVFGLSKYTHGSLTQIHPGGCKSPGVVAGDDGEAIIDAEYASAAAPDAAIVVASCANTKTTFGGLLALRALIDRSSPPAIISISYTECEPALGAAGNAAYRDVYQQAAAEGVSVFVSSGDEGAAGCDANEPAAKYGIAVSGFASTPYNVAVGGTDFGDSYAGTNSQYWHSKNNSIYGSAKSYIPEIPWNDSCASTLITKIVGYNVPYGKNGFCNSDVGEMNFLSTGAASGGPSGCAHGETSTNPNTAAVSGSCRGYPKPPYQMGVFGVPNDHVRDLPDVSLFAGNGVWGHYYAFCYSDDAGGGAPCTGNPANWAGAGGTSFSAPILAGIQALVNQSQGASQGNPNYVYYALAKMEFGGTGKNSCIATLGSASEWSCIFHDVAQGDIDVNCLGSFNCYKPSGTNGVLSTTSKSYSKAYGSKEGWDFATGIGTVNVGNLVKQWKYAVR